MDIDRVLMQRIARRDQQAFTDLVERYIGRLLSVARRLLGSREDAEDAVQRALLRCYTRAGTYKPEWAVSTWLYRVLTNICVDELRRRASRDHQAASLPLPEAGSRLTTGLAGRHFDPSGRYLDLHRALLRVPQQARILLALRYVNGLSYVELARIRGISENTVKSQLARGKAILRKALGTGAPSGGRGAARGDAPAGRAATGAGDAGAAAQGIDMHSCAQGAER